MGEQREGKIEYEQNGLFFTYYGPSYELVAKGWGKAIAAELAKTTSLLRATAPDSTPTREEVISLATKKKGGRKC